MRRLRQLRKQQTIQLVARRADGTALHSGLHTATGFVQMRAVVKLAVRHMRFHVGHVGRELHGIDVMQAKFLKTG